MALQLPYVILDPYIEADLQYLLANSGGGGGGPSTYDIAMEYTGVPVASTNILVFNAVRPFTLVAGLAGSYFTAQTAPSGTTVFTILQNTTAIGTITFASGATSGTASFSAGVTFSTGDELIIQSPSSVSGLTTLAITFKGTTTTVGGASTIVVQQAGTAVVPTATTLNFTGTNVTVTNPGSGVAAINITANPSITVGSTVIVGGTSGYLLYDNAGVVGELAILPVASGGTGTATPSLVAGTNVTISGSWPNQTINASGGGGGGLSVPQTTPDLVYLWDVAANNLKASSGYTLMSMTNSCPWNKDFTFYPTTTGAGITVDAATLNGYPVVSSAGSSNANYSANLPSAYIMHSSTVFALVNMANVSSYPALLSGNSNAFEFRIDNTGKPQILKAYVNIIGTASTALTTGTWGQCNVTYNDSTGAYAFRVAKAAAGSGTNALGITSALSGLLYNPAVGGENFNGSLAFLAIYNRVLTAGEITAIEAYLTNTYGV